MHYLPRHIEIIAKKNRREMNAPELTISEVKRL